ncbi:MAG: hypothetical protein JXR68_10135 [Bacteroidales bacterium]|nr:hypothetical protein [Bacteroidales bacterium]
MKFELTDNQKITILEHLKRGNKIEAIKFYRSITGEGLKESKEFIDILEKNKANFNIKQQNNTTPFNQPEETSTLSEEDIEHVKKLLQKRQKLLAVKFYKEKTSCSLREAKEQVEYIEQTLNKRTFTTQPEQNKQLIQIQKTDILQKKHQPESLEKRFKASKKNIGKSGCLVSLTFLLLLGSILVFATTYLLS